MLVTDVVDKMLCWQFWWRFGNFRNQLPLFFYISIEPQHSKDVINIEIQSPTSTNRHDDVNMTMSPTSLSSNLRVHSKPNSRNKKICPDKIINLIWNLFWACGMHQCCSFHFHCRQRCRTLHQWMKNIPTVRICLADQCEDGCLDLWISAASHWIDISPVIKSS